MHKLFTFIFIFIQMYKVFAENKTKQIEELEKEKGKLFEQINEAIEDSITLLKNNNDSEAILGINYMTELKDHLKAINGSDYLEADLESQRRSSKTRSSNKEIQPNIFELANIFKKGNLEKIKEGDKNRVKVQKTLDEWMKERELEKRRIREYKERMKKFGKVEKCPRYGLGKKNRKISRRKGDDKNPIKPHKLKKTKPKYPCCRKCCKKSYMGCL